MDNLLIIDAFIICYNFYWRQFAYDNEDANNNKQNTFVINKQEENRPVDFNILADDWTDWREREMIAQRTRVL